MLCNCSSCDQEVDSYETDNYGRCESCQNEYGEIEEFEDYL